jgi:hypothetical protein
MSTWDDKPNDREHAVVVIADLLRRELRLNPGEGRDCKCGEWIGTWRVTDGNIEHCARLIAETLR